MRERRRGDAARGDEMEGYATGHEREPHHGSLRGWRGKIWRGTPNNREQDLLEAPPKMPLGAKNARKALSECGPARKCPTRGDAS